MKIFLGVILFNLFLVFFPQIVFASNSFVLIENLCANASYSNGNKHYQSLFGKWSGECEGNEVSDGVIDITLTDNNSDYTKIVVIRINFYEVLVYSQSLDNTSNIVGIGFGCRDGIRCIHLVESVRWHEDNSLSVDRQKLVRILKRNMSDTIDRKNLTSALLSYVKGLGSTSTKPIKPFNKLTKRATDINVKCFISDSEDTALNVRDTPNGKIINRLKNGREIIIKAVRHDKKGRPWGYAIGYYKGKLRNWGWVFTASINC